MNQKNRLIKIVLIALLVATLPACKSGSNKDFIRYLKAVKTNSIQTFEALPKFSDLSPYQSSMNKKENNPFRASPSFLSAKKIHRDNQESLQNYSVKKLFFVGVLRKESTNWALIKQANEQIAVIKVGDLIGKEQGKVVKIGENSLNIEESLQSKGKTHKKIITLSLKS